MPLDIKPINSVQKHPHINESYAYILKIFVTRADLSIDFLISLGMSSTPKVWKQVTLLFNEYKAIQWVQISEYSSRFVTYAASFILSYRLSLEYTALNSGSFW